MAQTVLSICITEEDIRICEVRRKGKKLQVNRTFRLAAPRNSVDSGMIVDVEEMAQALKELFVSNGVKKASLAFTIFSKRIASKEITLPLVKNQKRIEEMIRANIRDYLPMANLEEYIWRYTILDTVKTEETGHYNIALTAVRKDMIASYYELAGELGMPVETVDYYGNSIYNIISRQMEEGITLALQVDADVTHVSIMDGRTQLFRRTVPHGKEALIQIFSDIRRLPYDEADRLLTKNTADELFITDEEYREMISDLAASTARVVEFYTTRNPGVRVEQAKVFGEGLGITGLAAALERELEIRVSEGWELEGIVFPKKNVHEVTMEELSWYLPNLGALLEPLDLKPEEEKKKVGGDTVLHGMVIAAAVTVILLAGLTFYRNYTLKQELAAAEAEASKLEPLESVWLSYENQQKEYELLKGYYDGTADDTEELYQFVLTLEEVMPQSVGIGSLTVENGAVSLTGMAAGKVPVAAFIAELKKIPCVSNVYLSKTSDTNEGSLTEFEIGFQISPAAALADTEAADPNQEGGTANETERQR